MATPNSNSVPVTIFDPGTTGLAKYLLVGSKWGGDVGTGVTLTYSYYDGYMTNPEYLVGYWSEDYPSVVNTDAALSLNRSTSGVLDPELWIRDWNDAALQAWASAANIKFTKVADNKEVVGELRFAGQGSILDDSGNRVDGSGFFPGTGPEAGDVWYNPSIFVDPATGVYYPHDSSMMKGSYRYFVMLHEIGHALGLKHPHEGSDTLPTYLDDIMHTVMSYDKYLPGVADATFFPTTPMYFDLLAIKALYGERSVRPGDTSYVYNEGEQYFETIDDSGGYDTIIYNGSKFAWIKLTPGEFSTLSESVTTMGTFRHSVTIGPDVVIEAAVGGDGNDILEGNDADNSLNGRLGADTMRGGAGNDTYYVDNPGDIVDESVPESDGFDVVYSSIAVSLDDTDMFRGEIESLVLTGSGPADINGNALSNILAGTKGRNVINGLGGGDFIAGGGGGDQLDGGPGFDSVSWHSNRGGVIINLKNQAGNGGSAAGDTVANFEAYYLSNTGWDVFTADDRGAYIYGFGGNDIIRGGKGSDFIDGGAGADTIDAGGGFDYISWNTSPAGLTIDMNNPAKNTGVAKGDVVKNAEAFYLSEFNDTFTGQNTGQNIVFGQAGNDKLYGGKSSNDWLFGGAGNDILIGGTLNDLLSGGAGKDTYVFQNYYTNGLDQILDFVSGQDVLQLDGSGFGLAAGSTFKAGSTFIASSAPLPKAAGGTMLYNMSNGFLSYDIDGTGSQAAVALAQLGGHPSLSASDFHVV